MYTARKVQTSATAVKGAYSSIQAQLQVKHVSTGTSDDQGN
jgi:hypothetical protein